MLNEDEMTTVRKFALCDFKPLLFSRTPKTYQLKTFATTDSYRWDAVLGIASLRTGSISSLPGSGSGIVPSPFQTNISSPLKCINYLTVHEIDFIPFRISNYSYAEHVNSSSLGN